MPTSEEIKQLFVEFPKDAISWRAQSVTKDGTKAMALAYIDARDVMERLDQVCGAGEWQCDYPHAATKTVCRIGIKVDGEWVWKSNGAGDSDIEAEKGALSDAFKRAAVLWGIGRYLYDMPTPWVPCEADESEWNGKKKWVWKRWRADPWDMVVKTKGINKKSGFASSNSLQQSGVWTDEFEPELLECNTVSDLTKFAFEWSAKAERSKWPENWRETAKDEINKRKMVILNGPRPADLNQHPIMAG